MLSKACCVLLFICLIFSHVCNGQYGLGNQTSYLSHFNQIVAKSFQEIRPSDLTSACAQKSTAVLTSKPPISLSGTASVRLAGCGPNDICTINPGVIIRMDSNVNVGALINMGTIEWTDATQPSNTAQWLCAGYVVTEANGNFTLVVQDPNRKAFIYLKDNSAVHPFLGVRVFGGHSSGSTQGYPLVRVQGRPFSRTWSLLSKTATISSTKISLQHNVAAMGWLVGDRIALAPTTTGSDGEGRTYYIKTITGNSITLSTDAQRITDASLSQQYSGTVLNHQQAEVMVLTRNVIITGDDFTSVSCAVNSPVCPCPQGDTSKVCSVGLHTLVNGSSGVYNIQHTRVEKCGQRGFTGRYCIHFHFMRECPACIARGNAVEYGQQRGIVVHATHTAIVTENTLYDVRGAGIYIEDGNELYNHIEYNVVICPWKFSDPVMGGCTIPGTDNVDADNANNQASYWSLDHTNHFIGNRAANSFNGLFFDPSMKSDGRGMSDGKVCVRWTRLGRVQGNTCHGHLRFGTYFVSNNYPRQLPTTIAGNGQTQPFPALAAICDSGFTSDGYDLGLSSTITNNVDYHNVFVGAYAMGDIQWRDHYSIDNTNLIYHKETKNFQDGCSAHYKNYHFENHLAGFGQVNLPAGYGTVIFEKPVFKGSISLNPNLDCGTSTGVICNSQYILENPTWEVNSSVWVNWAYTGNPVFGGVFNLAPNSPPNNLFPNGYQGFAHGIHTYLLGLDGGNTCTKSLDLGMNTQFAGAILCKKPLRRLEVYTQGFSSATAGTMKLLVTQGGVTLPFGTMRFIATTPQKQGFVIPIVASLNYVYELVYNDGALNQNWIVDFSDPVIGNRYGMANKDEIHLKVRGRVCNDITSSQHDRRWLYATASEAFGTSSVGRGACSGHDDMPAVNCAAKGDIELMNCPTQCTGCNGANQYCDCRDSVGVCLCKPGFSGPGCTIDICAAARCGPHGTCSARFLGGDLWVADAACACETGWTGPTCEANPCNGVTCNGHGSCVTNGESDYTCQCKDGYYGKDCLNTCENKCSGNGGHFPYGCEGAGGTLRKWCGKSGGCAYGPASLDTQNNCCYLNCNDTCASPCEEALNDCYRPGYCSGTSCILSSARPNGAVCHSQPWGTCQSGTCVAQPPPSSSATATTTTATTATIATVGTTTTTTAKPTTTTTATTAAATTAKTTTATSATSAAATTAKPTTSTTSTTGSAIACENVCNGNGGHSPFGCQASPSGTAWCSKNGPDCSYSAQPPYNPPEWCCYKNCPSTTTTTATTTAATVATVATTAATVSTATTATASTTGSSGNGCNNICVGNGGQYPFGCQATPTKGWCSKNTAGCNYDPQPPYNPPEWCCYYGSC